MKDVVLSPVNGLPLSAEWHSKMDDILEKVRSTAKCGDDYVAVRAMHWLSSGQVQNVGDSVRARSEPPQGELFSDANV